MSSPFISVCVAIIPGVIISPSRQLDVANEMLENVLKCHSCCLVFVDREQMLDGCVANQ